MTDIYYVYQYVRSDGSPYYVGMGHGSRAYDPHPGYDVPKNRKFIEFVASDISEKQALQIENVLTNLYGLIIDGTGILENKIHGGNTSPRGMLGKNHSDEARKKISIGNLGKIRSEAHKQNYRKPKTEEHVENIRKAVLETAKNNPERYVYNKSFSHKGKPWSEARRAAQNKRKLNDLA